jgi:hypothetical protein
MIALSRLLLRPYCLPGAKPVNGPILAKSAANWSFHHVNGRPAADFSGFSLGSTNKARVVGTRI